VTNLFGKYRLVAELGQGGMADVLLAVAHGPVGFNKLVVIKKLREHLADDPEFVGMLIDEARLAARLNHPNIVHTHEVGEVDGHLFMAMEYLDGQPWTRVRRRLARRNEPRLPLEMDVRILCDVLAGLGYAHDLKDYDGTLLSIVHRDVTPSNVFITYDGVVKILDFGIAKATGRTTETRTGVVKGKMAYMPPEQAMGRDITRRADLFSVGVMLWEAACGQRMWRNVNDVVILGKLISGDVPRSPRLIEPSVPAEIDAICQKALAPNPAQRYASAEEFHADLEGWLGSRGAAASHRELGRRVGQLFNADRTRIRELIEGQLARLKNTPPGTLEPVIIADPLSTSSSSLSLHDRSHDFLRTDEALSVSNQGISSSVAVVSAPRRRRPALWAAVALVAGLSALVAVRVMRPVVPEGVSGPAASGAVPAPGPPAETTAAPHAETVRIALRAVPADARFSIDDGPLLENPYVGERPRDEREHAVRIEAPGHEPKIMAVSFDRDVMLDVTLSKATMTAPRRGGDFPRELPRRDRKPPPDLLHGDPWNQ
jgi:serine/threonine-protein kinase